MKNKNIKKIDLANDLSLNTGYSVSFSKKLISDIISSIIISIKNDTLKLTNIGTFKIIKKNRRIGRNPKTGKEFIISARNSISFIPSKKIFIK